MKMPAGSINGYKCHECGKTLITVHVTQGVTPASMTCSATDECRGMMFSLGYPNYLYSMAHLISHEWFRPSNHEMYIYKRHNKSFYDHVIAWGLGLRELTDAGRRAARLID